MSKRMYEDLKEILCHELNEITRKGDIDREGLDDVYKLSSAITMVESLMKKGQQGEMSEYSQMSNRGGSNHMPMWSYEGSYESYNNSNERGVTDGRDGGRSRAYRGGSNDYSQDSYESYRRGRGADGRYVSRDGSYGRGSNDSYDGSYESYESYERGYSRDEAKQMVISKLENILNTTKDNHIRNAIMQAMNKIEQ